MTTGTTGKKMLLFYESATVTTEATAADISVRIAGSTSFSATAPDQKAKMVQKLFEGLMQLGIAREDLVLRNVSFSVEKGLLTKSAAAVFDVLVRCQDVKNLGPTMGKLAESKLTVTGTAWIYGQESAARAALTATCVAMAAQRADAVAAAYGLKAALASVEDTNAGTDQERPYTLGYGGAGMMHRVSASDQGFNELTMASFKDVRLSVKVGFELQ